jgi:DNA-binding beta-propeller fold protein YncE
MKLNKQQIMYNLHKYISASLFIHTKRPLSMAHTLHTGHCLAQDGHLISPSGNYHAVLQNDGNFVVYVSGHTIPANALWSSKTNGKGVQPYTLQMRPGGNLVLYDGDRQITWSNKTHSNYVEPFCLTMQDDGNLVLYDFLKNAIWASNTMRT